MTRIPSQMPMGDDTPENLSSANGPEEMPVLGASDDILSADAGIIGTSPEKKVVSSNIAIFAIVLLVASGALYGMHIMNNGLNAVSSTKDIEAKIETYLTKLNNPKIMSQTDPLRRENMDKLFHDTPDIVNVLQADVEGHQIPIEYVKKDPFALAMAKRPVQNVNLRLEQQKRLKRAQQLSGEAKQLDLQSVMGGRVPVAIIDGEFYKKGDQVDSFTIVRIDNRSQTVELLAEGLTFELVMD